MTAIVGLMNKHAVALAADSAVTVSTAHGRKVLNCANKIFNISKYEPVGVMIYNNSSLMGTPWDLIIKMFRQNLKATPYDTLNEYIIAFLDYIASKNYFNSDAEQRRYLLKIIDNFVQTLYEKAHGLYKLKFRDKESPDELRNEFFLLLQQEEKFFIKQKRCKGFETYTLDELKKYLGDGLLSIHTKLEKTIGIPLGDDFINLLNDVLFLSIVHENTKTNSYTGLVFSGYGTEEMYPSLISLIIRFAFDGKIVISSCQTTQISNKNPSAVCPFAQTDVMMSILAGIASPIHIVVNETFNKVITGYNDKIIDQLKNAKVDLNIVDSIKKGVPLDVFRNSFEKRILKFIDDEYITKLKETVAYLDIEDLSNMAESLISITGLNRRMTSEEESVGGPVDVAVISKVDGFIWMKRKHYFDKNLNQQFFERYNR